MTPHTLLKNQKENTMNAAHKVSIHLMLNKATEQRGNKTSLINVKFKILSVVSAHEKRYSFSLSFENEQANKKIGIKQKQTENGEKKNKMRSKDKRSCGWRVGRIWKETREEKL